MSTAPPIPPHEPAPVPAAAAALPQPKEIRIISHSNLYYWWPVWAIGFILAGLTWLDNHYMYILPGGTTAHHALAGTMTDEEKDSKNPNETKTVVTPLEKRDLLLLPKEHKMRPHDGDPRLPPDLVTLHVARSAAYGPIFATVLVLVIVITNVPLRGMWSLLVIITVAMLIVILSLIEGAWESLFRWLSFLDIRINGGGYLFISLILFIIWAATVIFFDRQIYMSFSAGQLKVCTEIGDGEKIYDTSGLSIEKQKTDFFRHIILGLGSGDIIVKTAGAHSHQFEMQNILWVGSRLAQIERLTKQRAVVAKG